jgi:beta-lactamase class C
MVAQKVKPISPENGSGGGVAVAARMDGKTSFFNYGMADDAQNRPVTADSIFNLSSVGKHATRIGRQILHALAPDRSEPSSEGEPNPDE